MKVLITGATGLIGNEVVECCHREKIKIHFLTTSQKKLDAIPKAKGFLWNPKKGEIDTACFEGVNKIINLVGETINQKWTSENKKRILNSRVETANLLFKKLKERDHQINQIVSASAIGIYPSSYTQLYTEDFQLTADNFLGEVVEKWETAVDQFESLGMEVAKLRIGLVLAKNGGALPLIKKTVENYVGAPLAGGRQWQSWIHVKDLAKIFVFAANKNLDGVYNAVATNPVTNKRFTYVLAKKMNRKIIFPTVPEFALKLMLGERATLVAGSQLVSNSKIDAAGFKFIFTHIDAALKDLTQ